MQYNEEKVLNNIIRLRKEAGFTQKAVEQNLGLRSGTIYDHEKGRLKLSLELAFNLCKLYGVNIQSLVEDISTDDPRKNDAKVSQLLQLGIISNPQGSLIQLAWTDPIIVAEIGLEDSAKGKDLFSLLLENLSAKQKQGYLVEIFRYVNSLIGCDKKITDTELQLRNAILHMSPLDLEASELTSIKKAFTQKYLGKSSIKYFPRDAYKHFLIWTLYVVALSDGHLNHLEEEYIREVGKNISLKVSSLEFISEKISLYQHQVKS